MSFRIQHKQEQRHMELVPQRTSRRNELTSVIEKFPLENRVCHRADQITGEFHFVLLFQEAFDLAHRHTLGIHRVDEASEALLSFAD
jgi:hypothetical protein